MEGGELAHDGAGEGAGPIGWAGDGEDSVPAERDRHRCAGEPAGPANEALRDLEELRVVLCQRPGGGVEPDRGGQRDRASPDPDAEEVVVVRSALPEAVGLVDRRPQLRWVGVEVPGGGELGGGHPLDRRGDLTEVGEVAGALAAAGAVGGATLGQAEGQPHRDRGHGRADHQRHQPGGAGAGEGEQEHDRPAAADQRHQVPEPAGEAGDGPPDHRWGRHHQLARRRRPRMRSHRPVHHHAVRSAACGRHDPARYDLAAAPGRPRANLWTTGGQGPQGSMIV